MQIQAISKFSFKKINADNKDKEKKLNLAKFSSEGYYSKSCAYNALKLSKGREKEDANYKLNSFLAGAGAVVASVTAFSKSVKSLATNAKLKKAIKNSASPERIAELKKAAAKKQKGSTIALGIGLVLSAVSAYFYGRNKAEAEKTAKERGFVSDKEFTPELMDKININNVPKVEENKKENQTETKEPEKPEIKPENITEA